MKNFHYIIDEVLKCMGSTGNLEKIQNPYFLYDLSSIGNQIEEIKSSFEGVPFVQYYPIKANPCIDIVKFCLEKGIGVDACSLGDLTIADMLYVQPKNISFTGGALSYEDMRILHQKNIMPNLCSLEQIKGWASLFPGSCIGVRVSTHPTRADIQGSYALKMGIYLEEWPQILDIVLGKNLKIVRLHRHESKNSISHEELLKEFSTTYAKIPAWVWKNVNTISFGGGWGLPYSRKEKLNIKKLAEGIIHIAQELEHSFALKPLRIEIEPGEFLIGACGYLVTTVADVRHLTSSEKEGNLQIVILNTPFPVTSGFRPPELLPDVEFISNRINSDDDETQLTIIYGRSNTSMDVINKGNYSHRVCIGDLAVVSNAGAYAPVLLSHFNEQDIPAEFIIINGVVVKSREKLAFESHYKTMYSNRRKQ